MVIFDNHLPGLNGLDDLGDIYEKQIIAGVAIAADRDVKLLQMALDKHVLAYLVKPVEAHQPGPALVMAWARFQQLQTLSSENEALKKTLENRKMIERAKGVLMNRNRWTEKEAFRRLQKGAMNNRLSMAELSQKVLNGDELEL